MSVCFRYQPRAEALTSVKLERKLLVVSCENISDCRTTNLEKAKLVGSLVRTDNDRLDVANVGVPAGDSQG